MWAPSALPVGLTVAFQAAAGLVLGSFTATSAMRMAAGRSCARGRSSCDACGVSLSFLTTTPLVGYAISNGQCRRCDAKIDPVHPVAELAGALVLVTSTGWWASAGLQALMGLGLLFLAVFDLKSRRIPNMMVAVLFIIGTSIAALEDRLLQSLSGGLLAWLILSGARAAFRRLRGRDGFGRGDVKLIAVLAVWLGIEPAPWMLLGAVALAAAWAKLSRVTADQPMAFAPFLAVSAWGTWLITVAR